MRSNLLRYHYRIFTTMAQEIGTRNAVQCKSHHQKMLKKVNYCIENLLFIDKNDSTPIKLGEGQDMGNHYESIKHGIKNVKTNEKMPFIVVQASQKVLIVLDDRFI